MNKKRIVSWLLVIMILSGFISGLFLTTKSYAQHTEYEPTTTKSQSINVTKNNWAEFTKSDFNENALLPSYCINSIKETYERILNREVEQVTVVPETTEIPEPVISELWCTTSLNLRSFSSEDSDIINTYRKGTKVLAENFDPNQSWTKVSIDGDENKTGYMSTNYLSTEYIAKYEYYYVLEGGVRSDMDKSLQEFGQDLIYSLGMEEYIPYWYVQCYQESCMRMSRSARAHGGYYDWGIMQIWEGLEHDVWSCIYDVIKRYPDYKNNPYDNIACGIYQYYYWYQRHNGNIMNSLGSYLTGTINPSEKYINDVMSHWENLYKE